MPIHPQFQIPVATPSDLCIFILNNPYYSLVSFSLRFFAEVIHIRPVFNPIFNAFIILTLWPLVFFAIRTTINSKFRPLILVFSLVCIIRLSIAGLMHADYDGRYLILSFPWLIPLSALGMVQ
jgi:hypothetical protein